MSWRLVWSKKAQKQLLAIPKKQRLMILGWMTENVDGCENPRKVPNGKELANTDAGWRYRVGSYRVICEVRDGELVVKVVRVGHRQGVYSKIPKI